MIRTKISEILKTGESINIEFKECSTALTRIIHKKICKSGVNCLFLQ